MKVHADFVRETYSAEPIIQGYVAAFHHNALCACEKMLVTKYLSKEGQLLDVGCGVGRACAGLLHLGYTRIHGIDVSPGMVAKARQLVAHNQAEVEFRVQDVCCLDAPENAYAGAVAFHGITPIPTQQQRVLALTRLHHVLAPGSALIISTFLRENASFAAFWQEERERWRTGTADHRLHEFGDILVEKSQGATIFLHVPGTDEFAVMLEQTGFTVIESVNWATYAEPEESLNPAQQCHYWVAQVRK